MLTTIVHQKFIHHKCLKIVFDLKFKNKCPTFVIKNFNFQSFLRFYLSWLWTMNLLVIVWSILSTGSCSELTGVKQKIQANTTTHYSKRYLCNKSNHVDGGKAFEFKLCIDLQRFYTLRSTDHNFQRTLNTTFSAFLAPYSSFRTEVIDLLR